MEKKKFLKKLEEDNKQLNDIHKSWIELSKMQIICSLVIVVVIIIILIYQHQLNIN